MRLTVMCSTLAAEAQAEGGTAGGVAHGGTPPGEGGAAAGAAAGAEAEVGEAVEAEAVDARRRHLDVPAVAAEEKERHES